MRIACEDRKKRESFFSIDFPDFIKCEDGRGKSYFLEVSRNGWAPKNFVFVPGCFPSFPFKYMTGHTRFHLSNSKEIFGFEVAYPAGLCLFEEKVSDSPRLYFSRSKNNVEFFCYENDVTSFSCSFSLSEFNDSRDVSRMSLKNIDIRADCDWGIKTIKFRSVVVG